MISLMLAIEVVLKGRITNMQVSKIEVPLSVEMVEIHWSNNTDRWYASKEDIIGDYKTRYALKFVYSNRVEYAPLLGSAFVPVMPDLEEIRVKALAKLTTEEKLSLGIPLK